MPSCKLCYALFLYTLSGRVKNIYGLGFKLLKIIYKTHVSPYEIYMLMFAVYVSCRYFLVLWIICVGYLFG